MGARGGSTLSSAGSWQRAATGHGLDGAIDCHLSHARVSQVGDVEIARAIDRQPIRLIEQRCRGWSAIACKARHARAGDSLDGTIRRNLANPVDGGIGDVDVACAIHSDAFRLAQRGRESLTTIAGVIDASHGLNDVRSLLCVGGNSQGAAE